MISYVENLTILIRKSNLKQVLTDSSGAFFLFDVVFSLCFFVAAVIPDFHWCRLCVTQSGNDANEDTSNVLEKFREYLFEEHRHKKSYHREDNHEVISFEEVFLKKQITPFVHFSFSAHRFPLRIFFFAFFPALNCFEGSFDAFWFLPLSAHLSELLSARQPW